MDRQSDAGEHTVQARTMELAVAGLFVATAALVMVENWRIGAGWGEDGPGAGYFPFYVGLIMMIASLGTIVRTLADPAAGRGSFVDRAQLRLVMQVLVPTIVFAVAILYLGIYVSSILFIAFFMVRLGHYPIAKAVPIALLVPAAMFCMFELWFKVPLPKGPLEAALGY